MSGDPSPTPYEARIAIAQHLAGQLPTIEASPEQAAALWKVGLLDERDIGQLAMQWIERDLDRGSAELAAIALNPPASLANAQVPFEAALAEMGVTILDEALSELTALELYLRGMIEGRLPPMVAMNAAVKLLHNDPTARLRHPNRRDGDVTHYAGEKLALEYLLGPYYQLQEMLDGSEPLPTGLKREQYIAELEGQLMEEAQTLHRYLQELLPAS